MSTLKMGYHPYIDCSSREDPLGRRMVLGGAGWVPVPYLGVSINREPQNRSQYTTILTVGIPEKGPYYRNLHLLARYRSP